MMLLLQVIIVLLLLRFRIRRRRIVAVNLLRNLIHEGIASSWLDFVGVLRHINPNST
ncbi:hypothetical protein Hanom_Chr04g00280361 [Helianthus anomalus]